MSDSRADVLQETARLESARIPHVLITVAGVQGSTPQDLSAKMLVGADGRLAGTIGGGKLEAAALRYAAEILSSRTDVTELVEWDLKTDIGMTCGGRVTLLFEACAAAPWTVAIFGAGHISQALVRLMIHLPVALEVRDTRAEWINQLPQAPNLKALITADLPAAVGDLSDGAFVLCLTQGHQTDRPVLERALREGRFPFVGVIGSRSKAAVLRRELREAGLDEQTAATFHCPLGLELGSNHPQEIAISIAAQLLQERDKVYAYENRRP